MKEILLDTMDGYQFQKFVANLFKQLGFVDIKVGSPTADGGIDISMEQRTDIGSVNYIVECKHHPERAIGRPVIQKLHSAVLHTPVLDKGIVVTSGHFSSQAYPDYCMICSKELEKEKYVCSDCGIIVCNRDSSTCKMCGKPICKEHRISKRKFLILSDKYCPSCAKTEGII